ncbi:MAG: cellulose biosynthesis cyclic di-GMP-binding regulatory protein BcsB [Pseudomonadota bacterium]
MIILVLLFAVAGVAVADVELIAPEADLASTSLAELGFTSGYTFEGLQSNHEQVFHFPVPRSAVSGTGELIIDYESSPQLDERSMLRVDVNGAPRIARHLGRDASRGRLTVALSPAEIQRYEYLNVAVKASLLMNGDRCLNDRLKINYLHLRPGSGLRMSLKQRANSLREAWDLLPKQVRISLPGNLTEEAFANALLLARRLQQDGKQVEFLRLPEFGELIVADTRTLESAIRQRYLASPELRETFGVESITLPQVKDAWLLKLPDRQVVVFSEPFASLPTELFAPTWRKVVLGDAYDALVRGTPGGRVDGDGRLMIPLERLGLDLSTRYVSHNTSWHLPLSPTVLAGDLRPDVLHLEMISSPSDTEIPLMLQVFLNGTLQQVSTLPNDGLSHQLTAYLSSHDYKPGHNDLQLRVQRNLISGDCQTEPPAYPVQLTSNSYLVVSKQREKPQEFHDLHAWFANGFDLFVPRPDGADALANLVFLANLLSHNDYPLVAERIRFYIPGEPVDTAGPFIVLGEAGLDVRDAGVRFDRGRIRVQNRKGETLLDVDRLAHLTISQLVQVGNSHGLWILARDGAPAPAHKPLELENNSVAFSDSRGLLLTLNPAHREVSQVDYPEYQAWFDHLGRYRFWLLALGWLLLTLLVAHLYSKAREHRKLEKDS